MITKRERKKRNAYKNTTTGKPGYSIVTYCPNCARESRPDSTGNIRASHEDIPATKTGTEQRNVTGKCGHSWQLVHV